MIRVKFSTRVCGQFGVFEEGQVADLQPWYAEGVVAAGAAVRVDGPTVHSNKVERATLPKKKAEKATIEDGEDE